MENCYLDFVLYMLVRRYYSWDECPKEIAQNFPVLVDEHYIEITQDSKDKDLFYVECPHEDSSKGYNMDNSTREKLERMLIADPQVTREEDDDDIYLG